MVDETTIPERDKEQEFYLNVLEQNGYTFTRAVTLFNKNYLWVKSPEGNIFLERIPAHVA